MLGTLLVTGGAGFIGSALSQALVAQGRRVVVADNLSSGYRENVPAACEFIEMDLGDVRQYGKLDSVHFDGVLHLGEQSSGEASFKDPWTDFNSHATATFLLLELCRRRGVKRFVYASSMSIYGDPLALPVGEDHPIRPKTYYAAGKASAEAYVALHSALGAETTVFRMFSVYGPNQNLANRMQGMVSIYLSYLLEGAPILVKGSRERFRDFVFIDDVVDAWLRALDNPVAHGKTYNLGAGCKTTVEELLAQLKIASGQPDYPVSFAGSTPGDQFGMYADIGRLRQDLGWQPRTALAGGLAAMVTSYGNARS